MTLERAIQQFTADGKLKTLIIVILVDFLVGIAAAIKTRTFRLSYVADFLRNDLLGKLFPWFVLYAAGKLTDVKLPGDVTFSALATGAYVLIVAALAGSILKSLAELGLLGDKAENAASQGVRKPDAQPSPAMAALVAPEVPSPPK